MDRVEKNLKKDNSCLEEIDKEINHEMKGMTEQQRIHFTKEFMKAMLDTDCADIVFKAIPHPYNELLQNLKNM